MLKLSNLDKIFWPKEHITKGELLTYYAQIAPYILPHLKNRPLVLHRFPDGIEGQSFFQKASAPKVPSFMTTVPIAHEHELKNYYVIQNAESLLYIVNLGSIELHPFLARTKNLNRPDYAVFDLDPVEISFKAVVDVALMLFECLLEHDIPSFCKTSGGKGLHVAIPLNGKYDYEVVRTFMGLWAQMIHEKLPQITSLERLPKKRRKKVYIDILQNRKMQTIVCPYSVRGFPGALVATPLKWSEVTHKLKPSDFNIYTVPKRLKEYGDILKPILGKGIDLHKAIKKLGSKL